MGRTMLENNAGVQWEPAEQWKEQLTH